MWISKLSVLVCFKQSFLGLNDFTLVNLMNLAILLNFLLSSLFIDLYLLLGFQELLKVFSFSHSIIVIIYMRRMVLCYYRSYKIVYFNYQITKRVIETMI
jgi:hypothetical protein